MKIPRPPTTLICATLLLIANLVPVFLLFRMFECDELVVVVLVVFALILWMGKVYWMIIELAWSLMSKNV